ncbi:hypothetical protein E2562_002442 [Oryza meyeriana var. granulata]|uniref:TRF2/HOY1 PH-like domain-containing protein n=1 Tax=Oryza meyeriana var. granulata TaxID=110450 RepID=A0A6G1F2H6_9ORYZ|nr:hypothetical protein E2562_002442 [Oryza meyeriana var. granulata]
MVQLQEVLGKRRAEPAAPARLLPPPPAAAAIFKAEAEEVGDGNVRLHKRVKEVQVQPSPPSQDMHILDGSSPLGLKLRKSPSFLELIQMRLAMENAKKKKIKPGPLTACERVKASNFAANFLKIGTWEYASQYEGDLVAKCYYAKHKLVWEVLDAGLKRKIEIQWSDITALKATCPENGIGTLDLGLARPPIFFKETDPQPRKHTMWKAASDFTGGQASMNGRHILQCPSSLLSKNFEKLIQCDHRLNYLSRQPYVILDSPIFGPKMESHVLENSNKSKSCHGFSDLKGEHEVYLSKYTDHVSPYGVPLTSKNDGSQELNSPHPNSLSQLRSSSIDDLLSHLGDCMMEQKPAGNNPSLPVSDASSNELLEEITQCLLSDSQVPPASDEKCLMARVDSLCSLLEKDTVPATLPKFEPNDSGEIGVAEVDFDGFDDELSSTLEMETAYGRNPPTISGNGSYGELLSNLPRIASIPRSLFNVSEDFDD